MKLWTVSVEIQIPVIAETEEEAKEIAVQDAIKDDVCNLTENDFHVEPLKCIPDGYAVDSIIWHRLDLGDVTLKDAMEKYGEKP